MIDLTAWAETLGLRRKKTFIDRVQDAAEDMVESVLPVLAKPAKMARSVSFSTDDIADVVTPALRKTGDMMTPALRKTSDAASSAAAAAATTAAATGAAAAGVATGVGAFFGGLFSWLWWLTMFAVKAGLLVGVAYAGWQWLQSRRDDQMWNSGGGAGGAGGYSSSTYGSVGSAGTSSTSAPSAAPATAGAH